MKGPRNAVLAAKKFAKPINPEAQKRAKEELTRLDADITAAGKAISELLGIEIGAKPTLQAKVRQLRSRRVQAAAIASTESSSYQLFNLEPFTWRDKDGWPRLVFFGLDSPDAVIKVIKRRASWDREAGFSTQLIPTLPEPIKACYQDVIVKLRKKCKSGTSLKLRARYEGVIPAAAKAQIATAREQFKQVFIVAEPKGFSLTEVAIPQPVDPLIVGWDGERLWLVGSFDTTTVEEYAKREFTS
jgi:hypothetical protein